MTPPAVATGRLGRLYARMVVDDAMGTMVGTDEIVQVTSSAHAELLGRALGDELERCSAVADLPHVFYYDSLQVESDRIHLSASRAVEKTLAVLLRQFGRLHAAVAQVFVRAIVSGLMSLHKVGLACGGLALSSVYVCDRIAHVGAWFPPVTCLMDVDSLNPAILSENRSAQCILRCDRQLPLEMLQKRDVHSIAFLLIEMLTGNRVCLSQTVTSDFLGRDTGIKTIADCLPSNSMERAFVLELLHPSSTLESVVSHPYLHVDPATSTCDFISAVIQAELLRCRDQQHADAQQLRMWHMQFEKKFGHKPHAHENPPTIQRLQRRCRALHERVQELERRGKMNEVTTLPTQALMAASSKESLSVISSLALLDVESHDGSSPDTRRRSPAQNAFLRRVSEDHAYPLSKTMGSDQGKAESSRGGHEVMHQRKEVSDLIKGLSNQT